MRLKLYAGGEEALLEAPEPGQTFAQAIWLAPGVKPRPLCSGMALCGRCRIRFPGAAPEPVPEEEAFFTPDELMQGWRLACRHIVPTGDEVLELILADADLCPKTGRAQKQHELKNCFMGFDLGTTSMQWRCISDTGRELAQSSLLNPQAAAGPDVISRLNFSKADASRDQLANLILTELSRLLEELDFQGLRVERLCIAANSVMTHILLKQDLRGLAAAPYRLAFRGGVVLPLRLGKRSLPCVIPPLPAPFIGGDISAGILTLVNDKVEVPLLLADLGTNAELALLLPENRLFLASAPLGPAMEGIGPICGQPAGPGVATAFSLSADGIVPRSFDGEPSSSISATGYLSLISLLTNLGLMDRKGHFVLKASPMPLLKKLGDSRCHVHGQEALRITDKLVISSGDVELLLKVKASLRTALSKLLRAANVKEDEIRNFILSGAISEHTELSDLLNLGMVPASLGNKLILAGNTSLAGACILAADPVLLDSLDRICASARIIDLANDPDFLNAYLAEMTWQ